MKDLYIFSGLGADERVFRNLDFSGFNATFIRWIPPHKNENIESYAARLREQITTEEPVLIGMSLGGLMAAEVARQIKTTRVIIISSAKTRNEIPFYYRLGLYRFVPAAILKKPGFFIHWLFGVKTPEEKQILNSILRDTDLRFLQWAIRKVNNWPHRERLNNLVHIHGTGDRIMPLTFIKADRIIKNGGHLMILNRPDEVMALILEQLK